MLDGVKLLKNMKVQQSAMTKSCVKFVFPATWNRYYSCPSLCSLCTSSLCVCCLFPQTVQSRKSASWVVGKKGCWWVWTKIRTTSWKTIKHSVKLSNSTHSYTHLWSLHLRLRLNFTSEETPRMFSASHLPNIYRIYTLLSLSVCAALNHVPCWLF